MGERGLRETHARTLYRGLFGKFSQGIPNEEWTEATLPAELPQRIKTDLVRDFTMSSSRVVEQVASEGGFKLVVELQDKQRVETVVIRHHHESAQKTRYTVCVSSQVRLRPGWSPGLAARVALPGLAATVARRLVGSSAQRC
ncbi:hypothetical protein T484DRAFT_1810817 [Baffinella frigidus]|nr:hypothetical protein T484DRAFT_1810817 [Cryptophyta sp. CCMP2293]